MKEKEAGWERIAGQLIQDLRNGKYSPGDKLPSENKLAGEFQVPRSDVRRAYSRLKELGYTRIKIPTQTTSWLACKIYLDFGFLPEPQNALQSLGGWRIIKRLTDHPSLSRFRAAEDWEVLNRQGGSG